MNKELEQFTKQFFEGLGYYATETYGGKSGQDSYGLVFRTYNDDKYERGSKIYEYHARQITLDVMMREKLAEINAIDGIFKTPINTEENPYSFVTQFTANMLKSAINRRKEELAELVKLREELEI